MANSKHKKRETRTRNKQIHNPCTRSKWEKKSTFTAYCQLDYWMRCFSSLSRFNLLHEIKWNAKRIVLFTCRHDLLHDLTVKKELVIVLGFFISFFFEFSLSLSSTTHTFFNPIPLHIHTYMYMYTYTYSSQRRNEHSAHSVKITYSLFLFFFFFF